MPPESYIGITGFATPKQIRSFLWDLPRNFDNLLMIAVLAGLPNSPAGRYPSLKLLPRMFPESSDKRTLNLVHFQPTEQSKLLDEMSYFQDLIGERCHGFQLNTAWPDPRTIETYKIRFGQKTIVLQINSKAMDEVRRSPTELTTRLKAYADLANYALIDPSAGRGRSFDLDFAAECFSSIRGILPDLGLGVAGGLAPDNLNRLRPLLANYRFSIDVETGVRRYSNDEFDVSKAVSFAVKAGRLSKQYAQVD